MAANWPDPVWQSVGWPVARYPNRGLLTYVYVSTPRHASAAAAHSGDLLGMLYGSPGGETAAAYGMAVSVTCVLGAPLVVPFSWDITVAHSGVTDEGGWEQFVHAGSLLLTSGKSIRVCSFLG